MDQPSLLGSILVPKMQGFVLAPHPASASAASTSSQHSLFLQFRLLQPWSWHHSPSKVASHPRGMSVLLLPPRCSLASHHGANTSPYHLCTILSSAVSLHLRPCDYFEGGCERSHKDTEAPVQLREHHCPIFRPRIGIGSSEISPDKAAGRLATIRPTMFFAMSSDSGRLPPFCGLPLGWCRAFLGPGRIRVKGAIGSRRYKD